MTKQNWERSDARKAGLSHIKRNAPILETKVPILNSRAAKGSLSALSASRGNYEAVENPEFMHTHAIYNNGASTKLYEVAKVVRKVRRDSRGPGCPELVILREIETRLELKPVSAAAVKPAKVIAPAKR